MDASVRVHRVPSAAKRQAENPLLRVDGLVARSLDLCVEDVAGLPRYELAETFTCDAERAAKGQRWRGVRVSDVVAMAEPLSEARFIRVTSGGFVIHVAIDDAAALLCDTLDGQPLTLERGAPWRLVVPGGRCFTSVKWVGRLELAADVGRDSGERIERAMLNRAANNENG
jgi:DMSO/TMAO reductase YedYZ molybdopterin-dependent catalytic subunit